MTNQSGLVKLIILIVVAIIVLGYFGINIRSVFESGPVSDNLSYLWDGVKHVWSNYLQKPTNFIWGVFYNYIWLSFIENMDRIREGRGPEFLENIAPNFENEN